jgi:DNA-directed RNA polymerase beta' subunit
MKASVAELNIDKLIITNRKHCITEIVDTYIDNTKKKQEHDLYDIVQLEFYKITLSAKGISKVNKL